MVKYMLTTVDNPFNPFTDFGEWYAYDTKLGHDTSGILARVLITSDELSDADQEAAYHAAVDEIVEENPLGIHRKFMANEDKTKI